jgi:hypothetical protein
MTRQWLLQFMRITQLALTVAGVLLLLVGSTLLGVVAVAVGVSAFVVSGTGWYQEIYFERPAARARVCTNGGRADATAGVVDQYGSRTGFDVIRRHN